MYVPLLKSAFAPLELHEDRHDFFFKAWQLAEFDKGVFLTEAGKVERYLYVVVSGVQAIYILTPEGDKKVIGFSYAGSFSGVYDSFLKDIPSHYFLEALSESRMIRIDKNRYDTFFEMYPEFNYWGRIAHQELLIGRVKREIELITCTAKERFDQFMERCPQELKTIPQKYVASYLNMTPETFSRLRAAIS